MADEKEKTPPPVEEKPKAEKAAKADKPKRPIDPATGKPHKKGEIPLGCNEPLD